MDMEISYYYECYSFKAKYVPDCLKIDVVSAHFILDLNFTSDYNDVNSPAAQKLLKNTVPLLKKSVGLIKIDFLNEKIKNGSVILEMEIKLVRNSINDIQSLFNNDPDACEKFLGIINSNEDNCWHKNTQKIFLEKNYTFIGVRFDGSNEDKVSTTFPVSTTFTSSASTSHDSITETPSITATKTLAITNSKKDNSETFNVSKTGKSTQVTTSLKFSTIPSPSTEKIKITTDKNQNSITQNVSINGESNPTLTQADLLSTLTTISSTTFFENTLIQTTDQTVDTSLNNTLAFLKNSSEPNYDKNQSSTTFTLTSILSTKVNNCSFTETENGAIFETGNPYNSNSRMRLISRICFGHSYYIGRIYVVIYRSLFEKNHISVNISLSYIGQFIIFN